MPTRKVFLLALLLLLACIALGQAATSPIRAQKGMVISVSDIASNIGADVLRDGGNAVDAAVATALALSVTYPPAGNIGGGGFMTVRPVAGAAVSYDFREKAPAASSATMFMKDGKYDSTVHHRSYLAVGVPGTVAGLHLAWQENGHLEWKRLVEPSVALARDGFPLGIDMARSLANALQRMQTYPASVEEFSKHGTPYEAGEIMRRPDLARTLQRIADNGADGFYSGETARLIADDMKAHGGLITLDDLKNYRAIKRTPIHATYRGYDVYSMPPPSSGGVAIAEMLNILEGYDLKANGFGSAQNIHVMAESMRRAYADRARYLGDSDFNPEMPITRLTSKEYANELRKTIDPDHVSTSSPSTFNWPAESNETTQISVVDGARNAVSLTYTLEGGYGVRSVVPGAGFLLNNEMGDFNAAPGLTTEDGLIGTEPNLAAPNKRMLSSMSPTIVAKDGKLVMVTGSPGSRTIINTVLETIVNVVDFGMNAQEAVDAGRFHHQWLPDRLSMERFGFSADTIRLLEAKGHTIREGGTQGVAEVIVYDGENDLLEGGLDHRQSGWGGAAVQ